MKSIAALWAVLALAVVVAGAEAAPAQSSSLLIRNATVHTQSSAQSAVLESTDVLIENGRISAIGRNLAAPAGIEILDAQGQAMTPGIFGGLGRIGLEEIGLEETTGDQAQRLEQMRPEFDVRFAYNPESMSLGVHRSNGVTFSVLAPAAASRGSFVAGLGTVTALDGSLPGEQRALFVDLGGNANSLSGGSRAAQFMLLRQAVVEARAPSLVMVHDERLLTPSGRQVLLEFLRGAGPFVFDVDRAVDIRRVIEFAREEKIRAIVRGGAEAWRVAGELAAANIPVILDPLENLPYTFDGIGATLENAARLRAAGVTIVVSMRSEESQDAGKVRQGAGNAVAHGLAWDDGLAAITRVPAEIFGVADRFGSIVVGRAADLVLWSGDPLDVNSLPQLVFTQGVRQPIASRHTALRDRYFERVQRGEAR
jgi:hypothetical protein